MFQSQEPQKSSKGSSHNSKEDSTPSAIDYTETLKGFGRAINSGSDTHSPPAQFMVEKDEELKQGKLVQRKPEEEPLLRAKTAQQKPLEGGFLQRKTAQRKPEEELKQGKLVQRKPEEELKQGKTVEEPLLRAKTAQQKPLEGGFLQRKTAQRKPEEELKQGKLVQRKPEEELKQGKTVEEPLLRAKTAQQKPLEGGFLQGSTAQKQVAEEEELQAKKDGEGTGQPNTLSGSQTQMPEAVQSKMENSFGTSFSGVNIHQNDNSATDMGALAYTQGNNVHFAPGQYNPNTQSGQELLGHELTHVVQQSQGRVAPTTQGKGMNINDSPALENEADVMGRKAAQGKDVGYRSTGLNMRNSVRTSQMKGVIQRAVSTWGGDWDTDQYDLRKDKDSRGNVYNANQGVRGVDMELKFTPGANVDAELIGMSQSVQGIVNNNLALTASAQTRHIKANEAININTGTGETDEGTAIDRASGYNNPIYPVDSQPSASLDDENTYAGWGQNGKHYTNVSGNLIKQDGKLIDRPTRGGAAKNSRHIFETTAIATRGVQTGTYYGSVRWGWRTDSSGNFTKIPLQVVSQGTPSSTFMKASDIWNKANGGTNVILPVQWTGKIQNTSLATLRLGKSTSSNVLADLPINTKVTVLDDSSSAWHQVQVDVNQSGLVLNQLGKSYTLTGNILRGYISKELIQKDASYNR